MFLFSRVSTLRGNPAKVLGWATEMNELVNSKTDVEVTLWGAVFGYPIGTMAWTTMVESHAQLSATQQTLMADKAYNTMIEKGQDLISAPGQDFLRRIIHGEPGDGPPPVGSVATVITATAANGRLAETVQWGIDVSDHVSSLTGANIAFMADTYGNFGQVTWILGVEDMAAADAANDAMMTDAEYMDRIKAAADLFIPGSGHQGLVTRLA